MTSRYGLLIESINASNDFLVGVFLFTLFTVIAYPILLWSPEPIRRVARVLYLVFVLAAFIFTTVYFWLM